MNRLLFRCWVWGNPCCFFMVLWKSLLFFRGFKNNTRYLWVCQKSLFLFWGQQNWRDIILGLWIFILSLGSRNIRSNVQPCRKMFRAMSLLADFHSVEFSGGTGNLLFMRESIALNLNRKLRVTNPLLCKISSARKILEISRMGALYC